LNCGYSPGVWSPEGKAVQDDQNRCTKAFDIKVVANWIDRADGPEFMGAHSLSSHTYIHTNDDGIKLHTQDMLYRFTTILQGNVGAVINLGAYGKNRGVYNSGIEYTWVHRLTQSGNGFDKNGGMISTRACPEWALTDTLEGRGLQGAEVYYLVVAYLGGADGQAPANSVGALLGLGVDGSQLSSKGMFCNDDSFVKDQGNGEEWVISGLSFKNIYSYVNPSAYSTIYNVPYGANVRWDNPSLLFKAEGSDFIQNLDAVVVFPLGAYDPANPADANSYGYFACPMIADGLDEQLCWNTCGMNGENCGVATKNNFAFGLGDTPSEDIDWIKTTIRYAYA